MGFKDVESDAKPSQGDKSPTPIKGCSEDFERSVADLPFSRPMEGVPMGWTDEFACGVHQALCSVEERLLNPMREEVTFFKAEQLSHIRELLVGAFQALPAVSLQLPSLIVALVDIAETSAARLGEASAENRDLTFQVKSAWAAIAEVEDAKGLTPMQHKTLSELQTELHDANSRNEAQALVIEDLKLALDEAWAKAGSQEKSMDEMRATFTNTLTWMQSQSSKQNENDVQATSVSLPCTSNCGIQSLSPIPRRSNHGDLPLPCRVPLGINPSAGIEGKNSSISPVRRSHIGKPSHTHTHLPVSTTSVFPAQLSRQRCPIMRTSSCLYGNDPECSSNNAPNLGLAWNAEALPRTAPTVSPTWTSSLQAAVRSRPCPGSQVLPHSTSSAVGDPAAARQSQSVDNSIGQQASRLSTHARQPRDTSQNPSANNRMAASANVPLHVLRM